MRPDVRTCGYVRVCTYTISVYGAPHDAQLRVALVEHGGDEGVHGGVAERHQAGRVERVRQHQREPATPPAAGAAGQPRHISLISKPS